MKYGLLLVVCTLFFSQPCMAAYKCVDAEGNVNFSQTPCSGEETGSEVKVEASNSASADPRICELAGLYAEDAAKRMRNGSDYTREIDRYGGSYGAKPALIGLVNYIYSFRATESAPVRIASLARVKCQSRGFGPTAFEDLPVSEYYVYDGARSAWVRRGEMGTYRTQPSPEFERDPSAVMPPARVSPASQSSSDDALKRKQKCESLKAELQSADEYMRSGYSDSEGERLREQRRQLQEKVWGACK